jgi:replicative DNA helicase
MSVENFALGALAAPESEASIIGALLLDNGALERVGDTLAASDFFDPVLGSVYGEMQRQFMAGKPWDVVTISHAMGGELSVVDLNALAQYVPSSANLRRYVELVRERSKSRALLGVGQRVQELAMDHEQPIEARVEQAQGELGKLLTDAPRDEWISAADGMTLHTALLDERSEGKTTAMATGLSDLDEYLEGGVRPGELVIIGARPSMGKTALAMTIGLNMAAEYSVAMLSMEMPHVELRDRMTAMLGRVSLSSVKRPGRRDGGLDWTRVIEGIEKAKELNFQVTDQGGLTINQVRSKARNVKRLHGLNVLLVDYIGLMSGLDARAPRAYQLEEISRGLKTLAKELEIAVICLAQVNRKVEERADATPSLSDLRDSGAIEQDADVVMFVHRPIQAKPDLGEEFRHYAKLSVAKNRNGRCGVLGLFYQGDQTRFSAWSGEAPSGRSVQRRGPDL